MAIDQFVCTCCGNVSTRPKDRDGIFSKYYTTSPDHEVCQPCYIKYNDGEKKQAQIIKDREELTRRRGGLKEEKWD